MDINDVRIIITVASLLIFIGIVVWAWSSRQRKNFREAANLPLLDDDTPPQTTGGSAADKATSQRGPS